MNYSFDEIKQMSLGSFKSVLKKKIKEESLIYLLQKRKIKGKEIEYTNLQISEYLLPNEYIQSIEDKQLLFSLKNKMISNIDYRQKDLCICNNEFDLAHIYECRLLNFSDIEIEYKKIYNGTLYEQNQILIRMKINLKNLQDINSTIYIP